jgi:hypothetical protein
MRLLFFAHLMGGPPDCLVNHPPSNQAVASHGYVGLDCVQWQQLQHFIYEF